MSIPKGVEADAWIAAAESPEDKPSLQQFPSALGPAAAVMVSLPQERAQRARAVALARHGRFASMIFLSNFTPPSPAVECHDVP